MRAAGCGCFFTLTGTTASAAVQDRPPDAALLLAADSACIPSLAVDEGNSAWEREPPGTR